MWSESWYVARHKSQSAKSNLTKSKAKQKQKQQANMMTMPNTNTPIPTTLLNYTGVTAHLKETDVLCGSKNTTLGKHHGNVLLSQRVKHHLEDYERATTRQEKSQINRSIINYMREKHGSRFLRQKGDVWVEIEEQAIRDKVTHALRFASIRKKKDEEYESKRSPSLPLPSSVRARADDDDSSSAMEKEEEDPVFARLFAAALASQQRILREMMGGVTIEGSDSDHHARMNA